jgi:uncharacterized protein involved in exopolysaccharide biosynthesis
MELNEVVRRIFGEHWRLIVFFVSLGIGVAAGLHLTDARMYTASARAVLDTRDPESRAESTAIADTARAIATSPGPTRNALRAAHVTGRDAVDVAKHHVSVRGLGSSGVFQLSVSDRDPDVAAAIANALAGQVIRARLAVTQGQTREVLGDLGQRIDDLNARTAFVDARLESLNERIAATSNPGTATALRRERDRAVELRDSLAQQRSDLEVQQNSVLSNDSLRPKPTIISPAQTPTAADSSRFPADVVLGALLGLILGVGVAGLLETFRPTLVGGDALAKEFGTPFLGALPSPPDRRDALEDATDIAVRVRLAAHAAALGKVALIPVGPNVNVGPLAKRLEGVSSLSSTSVNETALGIRPFDAGNAAASNGGGGGLVLVVPSTVKKQELVAAGHLLTASRSPLLGLITYHRDRRSRRQRAPF